MQPKIATLVRGAPAFVMAIVMATCTLGWGSTPIDVKMDCQTGVSPEQQAAKWAECFPMDATCVTITLKVGQGEEVKLTQESLDLYDNNGEQIGDVKWCSPEGKSPIKDRILQADHTTVLRACGLSDQQWNAPFGIGPTVTKAEYDIGTEGMDESKAKADCK